MEGEPAKALGLFRAWIEGGILENAGSKAKKKQQNALAFVASSGDAAKMSIISAVAVCTDVMGGVCCVNLPMSFCQVYAYYGNGFHVDPPSGRIGTL